MNKKLRALKQFALHLGSSQITNQGFEYLTTQIGQQLQNLNSLAIHFKLSSQLTDEGIRNVGTNAISQLKKLHTLYVGFNK